MLHLSNMKCVYESIETPCTLCSKHGFRCGIEEKVDGPKSQHKLREQALQYSNQPILTIARLPPMAEDEALTDLDKMYLGRLLEMKCNFIISTDLEPWLVCLKTTRFDSNTC